MSAIESLGRTIDVIPAASGQGISMKNCAGILFVCTGNDTWTLTASPTFAGSYVSPGAIIVRTYKSTTLTGTAAWTRTNQTAANTVVSASGTVAFYVDGASLADLQAYVKVTAGAAGTCVAILGDLDVQRDPRNLAIKSA